MAAARSSRSTVVVLSSAVLARSSALRTPSRRSTSCRFALLPRGADASWSTSPAASGARSSASVAACASGAGSRSSPYAAKHSARPRATAASRCSEPSGSASGSTPGRQRADHLLPEVVVRQLARQPVPGDRMEPPLEVDAAGAVVGDPGLRAVEVAVDRRAEVLVEREHERRRRRARCTSRCGSCAAEYRTLRVAVPCPARTGQAGERGGGRRRSSARCAAHGHRSQWCIARMRQAAASAWRLATTRGEASELCRRGNRAVAQVESPSAHRRPRRASDGRDAADRRRPARDDRRPARACDPPSSSPARVQKWIALLDQGADELELMSVRLPPGAPTRPSSTAPRPPRSWTAPGSWWLHCG